MNEDPKSAGQRQADTQKWKEIVLQFQQPSLGRALWQIVNTIGAYGFLWYLMYLHRETWWIIMPLAALAGGFLVRVFIIFHDCGHGSYFKSKTANDAVGFFCGVLNLTPYYHWRWEHSIHHATAGDLDRRSVGDIWTMTVQEYLESSRWRRFSYRLTRNPFVLFGLAPLFLFVVLQRFPASKASPRERNSVHWMNLAILGMAVSLAWVFGLKAYLTIQLTAMLVAGSAGVWMFYIQHQFEDVYWERGEHWDYTAAALQGSSFYKLPRILQWFSGNIGFHHIHHLSPRIPNYNLQRCHEADPLFQSVKPVTLTTSLKSFNLRLWDEKLKKLVGFGHLRKLRQQAKQTEKG